MLLPHCPHLIAALQKILVAPLCVLKVSDETKVSCSLLFHTMLPAWAFQQGSAQYRIKSVLALVFKDGNCQSLIMTPYIVACALSIKHEEAVKV